jgi:sarcosine oxidase
LERTGPLVVAAGFAGHAFTFGPALARVVAGMLADQATDPATSAALAVHAT